MAVRFAFFVSMLFGSSPATAADWPGFRGPNRDGICTETGLLKSWPEGGLKLLWTAKNLGLGWGTPSFAGGVIYGVGSREGKDGVWALKEADGTELWFRAFATSASDLFQQSNGPASTPTVHNDKLYTVSADGTVSCLNAKDGSQVWTKNYVKDFGGEPARKSGVAWGYNDSVLADGDKIICTPAAKGAALVALKADTGETIWKADAGSIGAPNGRGMFGQGYSSPVKATIGRVQQYLILLGNGSGLVGVHADTGKVLWQYKGNAATGGIAQIPMPVVKDDHVWVSCGYYSGGAALLHITSKDKEAFEVKEIKSYKNPQLNNHHGGMVLVDGHIYFGHNRNAGHPVCVDFKTGEIKWGPDQKSPGGGRGSAAVLSADGRLYFRYENGTLVLIEPNPEELKVVSSFKLPEANQRSHPQSWPHPVILDGKLYIRDQTVMYCYDVKAK